MLFLLVIIVTLKSYCLSDYVYETKFFRQKVDHFGYANSDTFLQRYLVSDKFWDKNNGPIFFYTGNEGDITMFANNTGFMWDLAPEFKAMLVFAEHRYYGISLPYGKKSFESPHFLGYLTTEQALADFAVLIKYMKHTISNAISSPVIVFGGSYGGMLAAWMRMKYPHLVVGALSSSGPLLQFTNMSSCSNYYKIVTENFKNASPQCPKAIQKSWAAIRNLGKTDAGLMWLTKNFHLCDPLKSQDLPILLDWLSGTWEFLAMTNYPYATDFMVPLPAFPVKVTCKYLNSVPSDDKTLLYNIFLAVSVFQNYTGKVSCFNISHSGGSSLGEKGWDFQSCTEMVMPLCSDGINDMFEPKSWNITTFTEDCKKKWGVLPEADKAAIIYGGRNITSSNIIFSNGLLDPWSGGGILKSLSDSLVAILIPDAAHHLDLRASTPYDPLSVLEARSMEKLLINLWIQNIQKK